MAADGTVHAIHLAPTAGAPPEPVDSARAVAGHGLEGDRYYAEGGTFDDREGSDLTLVAADALDALAGQAGIDLDPGAHRRNVTTTGVDLAALAGEGFRIGDARCVGTGPCPPCAYLERHLDEPGLRTALAGRGGLRARIVDSGTIRTGDPIEKIHTDDNRSGY